MSVKKFEVSLEFSDRIDSAKLLDLVSKNIIRAIISEVNNGLGIAPQCDIETVSLNVKAVDSVFSFFKLVKE